jgi:protein SCO1
MRRLSVDSVVRSSCIALSVMAVSAMGCRKGLEPGQAGTAYTETEDGELILADGTRASDSSLASPKPALDLDQNGFLASFDLIERSGKPMNSEELKGQPYVASFFFSLCGSVCMQQNEKVQLLQNKFAGQPVRFISISCDPEVDRPDVLTEYAKKFDADKDQWLFLTGELGYIRRVGAELFTLPVERRFHAEKFVLVDANGDIYAYYTWTDPEQWQALQRDIAKMIEAGGTLERPLEEPQPRVNPDQDE